MASSVERSCGECGATNLFCEDCGALLSLRDVRQGWHLGQCVNHGGQHAACEAQIQGSEMEEKKRDPILTRGGKFKISKQLILENPRELMKLLAQVLIVRCEMRYEFEGFLFEGMSDLFEPVSENCVWPDYEILTHKEDGKEIRFEARKAIE